MDILRLNITSNAKLRIGKIYRPDIRLTRQHPALRSGTPLRKASIDEIVLNPQIRTGDIIITKITVFFVLRHILHSILVLCRILQVLFLDYISNIRRTSGLSSFPK